jgi:NADH:ubiquinone oxidoreductase subunit 5 (subunit L)/multisubunit Na+/H+ antiporter MnhA subunit
MTIAFNFLPLVVLLPLGIAGCTSLYILSGTARGDAAETPTARWSELAAILALVVIVACGAVAVNEGAPGRIEYARWLESGSIALPLSFQIDGRGLIFAFIVQLVGWITLRFSRTYLHREPAFHRFFFALNLFLAGMQIIVLAGDAALMFVGWELAGFSSWLLIGYDTERPTATGNALYAFVTNRVGDAGFILGLALAYLWVGSSAWSAITEMASDGALDKVSARMLLLGFFIAAVAKSAQLPLCGWLARALEGPTPSSAIFYGAIMVHAGVWMLIRLEPVLLLVPDVMLQVAVFGLLTALYGWLAGLAQTDVKSSLVFATTTQVGLMFLACGLGFFEFAFVHLCAHALLRAIQFLLAPSYMHLLAVPPPSPPAWLERRSAWYAAVVSRFWLDALALAIVIRPAQAVARDVRRFDDHILMPLLAPDQSTGLTDGGRSLGKHILVWAANWCDAVEQRITKIASSGRPAQVMRQIGEYFLEMEAFLERPRYLLLLIAVTFMVIL